MITKRDAERLKAHFNAASYDVYETVMLSDVTSDTEESGFSRAEVLRLVDEFVESKENV